MARTKAEKTAFPYKATTLIEDAIGYLKDRVLCTQSVPDITYRELLQLIAPAEHIDALMNIRRIADVGRYVGVSTDARTFLSHRGRNLSVSFEVDGESDSPVMPYRPIWLDHFPENRELMKALEACGKQRADIAIDWERVGKVFKYLNEVCTNPAQVRYLWPAITGILSMKEDLEGMRASLSQHVMPKSLPTLPMEVRKACRETAAIVAMALMLPPLEDEPVQPRQVRITFRCDL
jgi:hypothetical protein